MSCVTPRAVKKEALGKKMEIIRKRKAYGRPAQGEGRRKGEHRLGGERLSVHKRQDDAGKKVRGLSETQFRRQGRKKGHKNLSKLRLTRKPGERGTARGVGRQKEGGAGPFVQKNGRFLTRITLRKKGV